ncbi:Receptor tyrosine-protein kinase erbB-3 [Liparis tanakae]|uniref:Receptor tyrosine-protein kinase erbB-3 n=1 Tax=Liparis tanakae TaxID=230148 RepID=A0A4Z2IYA7_9TELE|nr:Receptor tyrosine-protein kinase erbB-3 [Liparis tanakae]
MHIHTLTSLGLRSLREISDGSAYISQNANLCYHHTVNWAQMFRGRRVRVNNFNNNRPLAECEGHVCDPLCSDSGCWGPGPDQCVSCRNYRRDGTCVASCNFHTGRKEEKLPQSRSIEENLSEGFCRKIWKIHTRKDLRMSGSSQAEPIGYLLMNPSPVDSFRQLWLQRSRLSSVRTLPERSEFRGSVREAELHEEGSRTGSLHRTRFCSEKGAPRITISGNRKLSSASSPSSYKVWTAEEEEEMDHDGYVLAGACVTPQRDVRIKQEYEDCEEGVAQQRDSTEKHQLSGDSDSGIRAVDDQGEAAHGIGRYEYMDIRRSNSIEGEDAAWKRCRSQTSSKSEAKTEETDQIVEVLNKELEEEEKYDNTNKQPALQGNASTTVMSRPDVLTAGGEMGEEYEEMTRFGVVPSGWEQADYQNLPLKGRAVSDGTGRDRCAGIGGYIKVLAGIGEPGSNTSFDNPDYWHSRLFLKPDAVRT